MYITSKALPPLLSTIVSIYLHYTAVCTKQENESTDHTFPFYRETTIKPHTVCRKEIMWRKKMHQTQLKGKPTFPSVNEWVSECSTLRAYTAAAYHTSMIYISSESTYHRMNSSLRAHPNAYIDGRTDGQAPSPLQETFPKLLRKAPSTHQLACRKICTSRSPDKNQPNKDGRWDARHAMTAQPHHAQPNKNKTKKILYINIPNKYSHPC